MKPLSFLPIAILFITISCGTSGTKEECKTDDCLKQKAYDKVIAVHDDVMPKLSQIAALKGEIEEQINTSQDSLEIAIWHEVMLGLDVADEAMWAWMRQFNSDLEDVEIKEALAYLKEEQKKIDTVAKKINNALEKAEASIE